jgi:hypothetical protein
MMNASPQATAAGEVLLPEYALPSECPSWTFTRLCMRVRGCHWGATHAVAGTTNPWYLSVNGRPPMRSRTTPSDSEPPLGHRPFLVTLFSAGFIPGHPGPYEPLLVQAMLRSGDETGSVLSGKCSLPAVT